jgi:hypothetical protein
MNHIHAIAGAFLVFGLGGSGFQLLHLADRHDIFASFKRHIEAPIDSFTRENAASLIKSAVEGRPVVARLRLGEIVVVDSKGRTAQEYELLARAKLIDLKQCRFPGSFSGPRRICQAVLTETARQYIVGTETPMKIIEVTAPTGPGLTNLQFSELVVAWPKLTSVVEVKDGSPGQKIVMYRLSFETTPVSEPLGISASNLSGFEAEIHLRRIDQEWRIES